MLKNKKGFTLIELLIVVAIIAILAAIAIPQFSQYRIKGYNSAALADLRNAKTAEEAFFSDWQAYSSSAVAGAAGMGGRVFTNQNLAAAPPTNATGPIAAGGIAGAGGAPSAAIAAPGFQVGVSQNVAIEINTSGAPTAGQSYSMGSKNGSGSICYGADSDETSIFWVNGSGSVLAAGGITPASVKGANDFGSGAIPGTGVCNGYPSAGLGSINWNAL
jgi:prepilin-type N-terminal cleavage/methylation domain-containing protein